MALTEKETILITGGTGHVGFATLVEALKAGFRVRAAVRSEAGATKIKAAKSVQPFLSQLEFIITPDMTTEGAFDQAVKDVTYVLHIASPIMRSAFSDSDNDFIKPAVRGTLGVLNSAKSNGPTIKRIVITSSLVVNIPIEVFAGLKVGDEHNETSFAPRVSGPYGSVPEAYHASKVAALDEALAWIDHQKPAFDVNHVAPAYTIGPAELLTSPTREAILESSNGPALGQLLGSPIDQPIVGCSVHIDDVARMHIKALDPKVPGGQFFIGLSQNGDTTWGDAVNIVKKSYPEAIAKGILSPGTPQLLRRVHVNNEATKKALGIQFQDYDAQVKSVVEWYLSVNHDNMR